MSSIDVHEPARSRRSRSALLLAALAACIAAAPAAAQLERAREAQAAADRDAAASQERIDDLTDRTQDAAGRYAQALAEADSLERYNEQLAAQVASQDAEIASIEQQLAEIETTNREIQPLMEQMVAALEQFVALDVPFLQEERSARVANLHAMLPRADVTISEKYRRILEAYQIELEYGRTLETYEGVLRDDNGGRTVEFVRLGRVSLMYRTLDGEEVGYWDRFEQRWVADEEYSDEIEAALRVAKQEGAPELLIVPMPAPEEARS